MPRVLHYMARDYWRGVKMKDGFYLLIFFFVFLLLPIVSGADFKQALQIDIPACYGSAVFVITSELPYAQDEVRMEGCYNLTECYCNNGKPQTVFFSTIDNITNTFTINGQYYIAPWIEYNSTPDVSYNPNEDNKRRLAYVVVVTPYTASEPEIVGVPVDAVKVMIIVLIVLAVVGVGIFIAYKILMKEKKVVTVQPAKKADLRKLSTKKNEMSQDDSDVQKYLKELEEEGKK